MKACNVVFTLITLNKKHSLSYKLTFENNNQLPRSQVFDQLSQTWCRKKMN